MHLPSPNVQRAAPTFLFLGPGNWFVCKRLLMLKFNPYCVSLHFMDGQDFQMQGAAAMWNRAAFPWWWGCPVCSFLGLCIYLYAHTPSLPPSFPLCFWLVPGFGTGKQVFFSVGCQMKNTFLMDAGECIFNRLIQLCGVWMVSGWLKTIPDVIDGCYGLLTTTFLSEKHWSKFLILLVVLWTPVQCAMPCVIFSETAVVCSRYFSFDFLA